MSTHWQAGWPGGYGSISATQSRMKLALTDPEGSALAVRGSMPRALQLNTRMPVDYRIHQIGLLSTARGLPMRPDNHSSSGCRHWH